MKSMKFQPGTFLEVDDLQGGRKVVLVGRDGVTCWDSVKADRVTPLVIHPVIRPVDLGSVVTYVRVKGLSTAARTILDYLRVRLGDREEDSLFVMRVLWNLPLATAEGWEPADATVQLAYQQAEEQERVALRIHEQSERYYQQQST